MAKSDGPFDSRENEYWYNVSPQEGIPIAGRVEKIGNLPELYGFIKDFKGGSIFRDYLKSYLLKYPHMIDDLRKLVSVSNKRIYLELSYIFSRTPNPSGTGTLCGCPPHKLVRHQLSYFKNLVKGSQGKKYAELAADTISQYFVDRGLAEISVALSHLSEEELRVTYMNLVIPREAQQADAKRRGHGAEQRLACLIEKLGCSYLPEGKCDNPMGSTDPNLDKTTFALTRKVKGQTFSFDMIILDSDGNKRILIQALIHTSDPGQYGVNKSDETVEIKRLLAEYNQRKPVDEQIQLWGLVDGVGFSENKEDTINKLLRTFDHFIQMNTLYKAGLLLHKLGLYGLKGIKFDRNFYADNNISDINRLYGSKDIAIINDTKEIPRGWTPIKAGKATLFI